MAFFTAAISDLVVAHNWRHYILYCLAYCVHVATHRLLPSTTLIEPNQCLLRLGIILSKTRLLQLVGRNCRHMMISLNKTVPIQGLSTITTLIPYSDIGSFTGLGGGEVGSRNGTSLIPSI